MKKVIVGIADGKTVKSPGVLVSYALGSCVGVCLHDRKRKVAGMAHILLPCQKNAVSRDNIYKFADTGISKLLEELRITYGVTSSDLTAKIAGGANMFQQTQTETGIGLKNIEAVKTALKKEGIPVIGEDTGENYGRTITFSAETGKLEVTTVNRLSRII